VQLGINRYKYIFVKANKIAQAHKASAICSLGKIYKCKKTWAHGIHEKNKADDYSTAT